MQKDIYTIRSMTREEIDLAIEWAAMEGWNPGIHDANCFHGADPNGFLVGLLGDTPIAVISAIKYGKSFGFIGFYIVKPEYRGRGYGIQIWNAAMTYLSGRNIGLDGVVAQQSNYMKSGFKLAYRNIRYEGVASGDLSKSHDVVNLSKIPINVVVEYDQTFFQEDRSHFLTLWLNQPQSVSLGILQEGKLSGYGMIRVCRSGYKIGPLFANAPHLAESLFVSLVSNVEPGKPFYLDIPETNSYAVALAKNYDMKLVFETARMYTGAFPDFPMEAYFGVTSFELG